MKSLHFIRIALCIALTLFCNSFLFAQDFVYKPKNPAFGGEVFNYQWLLNSANSQNTIEEDEDEDRFDRFSRNPIDDFADNLNRQILNQISRELVGDQFGEGGLSEGNYVIGDFQIDVTPTVEGLSISILDTSTGDQTLVVVPYL